ncbi:MAG TPA: trigger factor [Acidimicrobiales bacterium]|nr:trigger factor [Acidimicrobiales bacterium]
MKTLLEPLEGNKVKLSVEVEEAEFEKALDAAFRRIASEVRIPGFRPGKAPRRVIEARIGKDAARQEALRVSLPDYYAQAVRDNDVDPIAAPEIDITSGEESGAVTFEAVVEIRPTVAIPGYAGLQVTVPRTDVSDEDVDAQVDRLRETMAELREVARPAQDKDNVTIDVSGYRHGERFDDLSADDFMYEVGSGLIVPELDDNLRGARIGDILKFNAEAGEHGEISFQVLVKEVKEKVLPEVTDEWAADASEFESVAELRDDIRRRLETVRRVQARMALRDGALGALISLVTDEAPEPLVHSEMERRAHDLSHRLEAQGADIARYLATTGTSEEEFVASLREGAVEAVKADLALRALADAESIEATGEDLDAEVERLAQRFGVRENELRRQLQRSDGLEALRSDVRKAKALAWLVEHVEPVDEEGRPVDRAELEVAAGEVPGGEETESQPAPSGTTEPQPTAEVAQ